MCAAARAPSPPRQLRVLAPGRVATEKSPPAPRPPLHPRSLGSRLGAHAGPLRSRQCECARIP